MSTEVKIRGDDCRYVLKCRKGGESIDEVIHRIIQDHSTWTEQARKYEAWVNECPLHVKLNFSIGTNSWIVGRALVKCPVCRGSGQVAVHSPPESSAVFCNFYTCHGCGGKGWIVIPD